ncbi:MAG TPA: beta/gamma crystallin-related protein [Burkholderiales bacterium]|nr:beta/gamma crystallin-related protein [Burkholderiales bacterium]
MNRMLQHLMFGVMACAASTAMAGVTFFEADNFGGRQITTDRPVANLAAIGVNDRARSAIVEGGPWEVCADVNFGGGCTVLAPGRYPSLGGWSNRISSARSMSERVAAPQPSAAAVGTPRIEGFDVEPARRLTAGNTLAFTLYGTPGGAASVRIGTEPTRILLDEVEPGVYERTYTIKNRDRIAADTAATANLRLGNKIAAAILDESLLAGAPSPAERAAAAATIPRIDRFEADAPARLLPGEQLFFIVHGTPAGKARVHIVGVKGKLLLEEAQNGVYEGTYTIKDRDRIASDAKVTATLKLGRHRVSAILDRPLLGATTSNRSERRAARHCANCGVVEAINVVEVKGEGSYVGKIAGGVLGGLLGSQVGQGRGTTAAEIAGVVGGAVAGNEIEKHVKKTTQYEVVTRLRGGGTQTSTYASEPPFRVGDRVRVENGALVADR